jgi:hypothetical protein
MSQTGDPNDRNRQAYHYGLTVSMVAAQVGVVVVLIILAAVLGGLWLDRLLGTKPILTVLLVVASGPVSLFLIFRLATAAIAKLNLTPPPGRGRAHPENDEGGQDE